MRPFDVPAGRPALAVLLILLWGGGLPVLASTIELVEDHPAIYDSPGQASSEDPGHASDSPEAGTSSPVTSEIAPDPTASPLQSLLKAAPEAGQIRISLREVIAGTLQRNVAIAVQEYQSNVRREQILTEESAFDPTITLEGRANENEQQVASAFAVPDVSNTERQNWKLGLQHKLVTGTEYEVNYQGIRDETNSRFAGLNPQYTSRVEVVLTQPLLKNFGIDTNKKDIYIASNNLEISEYEFKTKVIDVITESENTYWDLVFSREDLKVKEQSVERARDLERRVRAQVEVGTMAPIEILQAQSEVASREEAVLVARKAIRDNEDRLKNIINLPFDSEAGQKELVPLDRPEFSIGPPIILHEAIQEALANRPDYLAKKKELENKNILVQFNKNQLYPSLDLVGTFGLNGLAGTAIPFQQFGGGIQRSRFGGNYGDSLEEVFSGEFKNWEVGLLFSYPLGNRAAKSRLSASRLEAAQLLLDIKDLEKTIVVEVREAVRKIQTDIKRVQAARVARRLAEEKLRAEEKKFEVGLSTSFKVLEFQTDLASEESKELLTIIDYKKSLNNFRKVKGATLEAYQIRLADRTMGQ